MPGTLPSVGTHWVQCILPFPTFSRRKMTVGTGTARAKRTNHNKLQVNIYIFVCICICICQQTTYCLQSACLYNPRPSIAIGRMTGVNLYSSLDLAGPWKFEGQVCTARSSSMTTSTSSVSPFLRLSHLSPRWNRCSSKQMSWCPGDQVAKQYLPKRFPHQLIKALSPCGSVLQ